MGASPPVLVGTHPQRDKMPEKDRVDVCRLRKLKEKSISLIASTIAKPSLRIRPLARSPWLRPRARGRGALRAMGGN
jgi:hypothetical protein